MSAPVSFIDRLLRIIVPTTTQVLGSIFLSLVILVGTQGTAVLLRIGITPQAISASENQFHDQFASILRSPIASRLALMTFWALVGLIAYLICWGAYNIIIEARNEVTLNTAYTNRGHWRGVYETLSLKAIAAVGLAMLVTSLWYGVSFWLTLSSGAVDQPSVSTALTALLAIIGLAVQCYAVFVFLQLTFTPWYREQSFTDA